MPRKLVGGVIQPAAPIVFNPSATVTGLSRHLRMLEQPAHAVANGSCMASSNPVGAGALNRITRSSGSSYFVEVVWRTRPFHRDRPETRGSMAEQLQ